MTANHETPSHVAVQRDCRRCGFPMVSNRDVHLLCELEFWKLQAERWKAVATGYRRFTNILAIIPYKARNRRMLMGFKSK